MFLMGNLITDNLTSRRQISFLKEATLKLEERAKQEVEVLEVDYTTKFEKLKNDKTQMENLYREEIHNLKVNNFL